MWDGKLVPSAPPDPVRVQSCNTLCSTVTHFLSGPVQAQLRVGEGKKRPGGTRPTWSGMKNSISARPGLPLEQEQKHRAMSTMKTEWILQVPMMEPKKISGHTLKESLSIEKC